MCFLKKDKGKSLVIFIIIFSAFAFFLTYVGCNEDLELNKPNTLSIDAGFHSISLLKSSNEEYQEINDAIEDFALIVAHSLQDKEFREFYKFEAMKKFDGDFDILYSNVKDSYVGGKSLHARISEIATDIKKSTELSFKTEFSSVDELVSKVPKLQIAIPVNCKEWNTNSFIPPVACLNSEMKKQAVTHIKAYERDGKLKMMDKITAPKKYSYSYQH